jgi:prepilin-type N-terminal cleavage/methylation domain-containing protein
MVFAAATDICAAAVFGEREDRGKMAWAERLRGFSLIELLTVISILSLLLVLTVPAVSGLMQAGVMERGVAGLSGALESARGAAMSGSTYTQVGLIERQEEGQEVIRVAVFRSKNGLFDGDYEVAGRGVKLEQLRLANRDELDALTLAKLPSTNTRDYKRDWTSANPAKTATIRGEPIVFRSLIGFTPQGEVFPVGAAAPATYEPWSFVGLKSAVQTNRCAALVIEGGSGTVTLLEPR